MLEERTKMSIEEEAIRCTYEVMLKNNPTQKDMLDIILKARLKAIGVEL